ncbi:MAG: hypothetical protein ACPGEB_03320, partial [Schleiferiaceae bacterium]
DESFWVYQEKEVAVLFVESVILEIPQEVIVESVTLVVPCKICGCAKLMIGVINNITNKMPTRHLVNPCKYLPRRFFRSYWID